ncbi:MAG: Fe(3+) ABC transporter substrate-binding protein [Symploca sp. SIO1C2]|nr:Fe(3+) ABC transporter substrate-binding protein [Symploca sp. SIO1C2]
MTNDLLTKHSVISIFAGLALLVTVGCNQQTSSENAGEDQGTDSPAEVGEVNLYSSRHYDTDDELYDKFTQKTGIKVNVIEGSADELIERIKTEGENSPADVFITVDAGRLWRADEADILQPIASSELESAIPENLRSPDGKWFSLSKRTRIIVYNKEKVKPEELSTYEALAEPEWKGRVCVRSSGNIYNQSLVAAMIEQDGIEETEKWAKGFVSNFARPPEGNDVGQIKAVAAGICEIALVNHYYVARLQQSDKPETQEMIAKVGVFFPNQEEDGTHVNISGGGVVATSPNQESAIKFLEYLATPEAQEIYANANNEIAAVTGVEPNATVAEFGEFQESEINVAALGKNNPEAVKLMDRVGWK